MTIPEEKQRLRKEVRALERKLDAAYRAQADRAIADKVLELPLYQHARTVFCFVSTEYEIETRPILLDALQTGRRLCVPRCAADRRMELVVIRSLDELELGAFDILEPKAGLPTLTPEEVDFAVLPCLSCDRKGRRLGRGGGYYDRFLAAYRGTMACLCRERLLQEEIPVDKQDVPVSWLITEAGVFPGEAAVKKTEHCIT